MHKLIIISGPSCAGKTPLFKAFGRLYPALARRMKKLVLYNSRAPRPGEKEGVDYFFRPRRQVRALAKRQGFIVMDVRGDLQALDLPALKKSLSRSDIIFEGNPFIGGRLLSLPALRRVPRISVFVSPLSGKDMASLKRSVGARRLGKSVAEIMKKKLLVRAKDQGRKLDAYALGDIEKRAASAFGEMKEAWRYDLVLVNHDGEDSPNWRGKGAPRGDARKTLTAFVSAVKGKRPTST